jgi:dCMP deaminase
MQPRINIDEYFMRIAYAVAARSTCLDRQVGCVLVNKENEILATGYNGAPRGYEHCNEREYCLKTKLTSDPIHAILKANDTRSICPAAHAEMNALTKSVDNKNLFAVYLTRSPCINCTRTLINTSVQRIIFAEMHRNSESYNLWSHHKGHESWVIHKL